MSQIWMDVDTALATVPVNMMPLIDDTDFKTIEDGVVFNQAGLALFWNFTTTAGVTTVTAVTPTSAGDYDWTDFTTSGMYGIEIPASGGASANNDTEGFGHFTGFATGILPWRGPIVGFRAAALNNALIDGGDVLDVSLTEMGGVAQSATDLKDFADAGYDPATNKVQGVVLVDTLTTYTNDTPQSADNDTKLTTLLARIIGTLESGSHNPASTAQLGALTDWIDGGRLDLLLDAIPTTAMRGTDDAATEAKQDIIDTNVDTLIARIIGTLAAGTHNPATAAEIAVLSDWINGGRLDLLLDAIKVPTDKMVFTKTNELDSNIQSINGVTIIGDGSATPFDV